MAPEPDITRILLTWDRNPKAALEELSPLVYSALRTLASSYLRRERPGHTLQPTALVHEAYLRMVGQKAPDMRARAHFYGLAARLMRQILVDSAREHSALKRDGGRRATWDEQISFSLDTASDFIDLNDAIEKLNIWDERKCRVIELRYFGGLSREEIADAMESSLATVKRDLSIGEAFLRRELNKVAPGSRD
jgi:RNA polymerase sigma factor (TIGR02999 family)